MEEYQNGAERERRGGCGLDSAGSGTYREFLNKLRKYCAPPDYQLITQKFSPHNFVSNHA
jgi:hypothetical protein